jgi:hypothetical protein
VGELASNFLLEMYLNYYRLEMKIKYFDAMQAKQRSPVVGSLDVNAPVLSIADRKEPNLAEE